MGAWLPVTQITQCFLFSESTKSHGLPPTTALHISGRPSRLWGVMVKTSINDRLIYNLALIVREQTLDIEKHSPFLMIRGARFSLPTQRRAQAAALGFVLNNSLQVLADFIFVYSFISSSFFFFYCWWRSIQQQIALMQ